MKTLQYIVKHYPLSLLLGLAIWVLCLIKLPKMELQNVPFIDKWTHFVMYFSLCSALWVEFLRAHSWVLRLGRAVVCAALLPLMMSGVIEIAQEYCTNGNRTGSWLDFLANAVGVAAALCVTFPCLLLYIMCSGKGKRTE